MRGGDVLGFDGKPIAPENAIANQWPLHLLCGLQAMDARAIWLDFTSGYLRIALIPTSRPMLTEGSSPSPTLHAGLDDAARDAASLFCEPAERVDQNQHGA